MRDASNKEQGWKPSKVPYFGHFVPEVWIEPRLSPICGQCQHAPAFERQIIASSWTCPRLSLGSPCGSTKQRRGARNREGALATLSAILAEFGWVCLEMKPVQFAGWDASAFASLIYHLAWDM